MNFPQSAAHMLGLDIPKARPESGTESGSEIFHFDTPRADPTTSHGDDDNDTIEEFDTQKSVDDAGSDSVEDCIDEEDFEEEDEQSDSPYYNRDYPQYECKLKEACEKILAEASSNPEHNIEQCAEDEVVAICAHDEAQYWREKNPLPQDAKIKFDEPTHTYTVWNEHINDWEVCDGSATALLKACTKKPFDAVEQSERLGNAGYGRYANKTPDEIRKMWDFGAVCGTAFHLCAEYVLNYTTELPVSVRNSPLMKTYELRLFAQFVLEFVIGKYEIVRTELCMADWATTREGCLAEARLARDANTGEAWYHPRDPIMQQLLPAVKLAGMADAVVHKIGEPREVLEIWDWKRTIGVLREAKKPTFYKFPCDLLEENKRNKFCVQTNTYKWFMEHTSGSVISAMKVFIFHPEHSRFVAVEVPDLQHMTQRLMRMRLKDKLAQLQGLEDAESVRYSAEIREYFERAPYDPQDMFDSLEPVINSKKRKETTSSQPAVKKMKQATISFGKASFH